MPRVTTGQKSSFGPIEVSSAHCGKFAISIVNPHRSLVADDNLDLRERLAHCLWSVGHHVITAETGQRALLALRDWSRPIDWLDTRAELPGLIDGWNLADEYHETQRNRTVVISGSEARISSRGDIVLNQPMPPAAFEAILGTFSSASPQ